MRPGLLDLTGMGAAADTRVDEVVRLESVAEQAVLDGDGTAAGFAARFAAALTLPAAGARASRASSATGTASTSIQNRPPRPR